MKQKAIRVLHIIHRNINRLILCPFVFLWFFVNRPLRNNFRIAWNFLKHGGVMTVFFSQKSSDEWNKKHAQRRQTIQTLNYYKEWCDLDTEEFRDKINYHVMNYDGKFTFTSDDQDADKKDSSTPPNSNS